MPTTKKRVVQLEDITHLLSRALMDSSFRKELLDDPEEVLKNLGFEPAPKTVDIIKSLGGDDGAFSKAVGRAKLHDANKTKKDGVGRAGDC